MTTVFQFFVFKTVGINEHNNFPCILFQSQEQAYEFIRKLKSIPSDCVTNRYMVLNNPQLLPDELRKHHMFSGDILYLEDGANLYDGKYPIDENMGLLKQCEIDNNTFEKYGFSECIRGNNIEPI